MTFDGGGSTEAVSAERLRELLLDLEQAERRERELRIQSEALLAGVRALTEAATPDDLFARILETLRAPLSFDGAFVLRPSREPGILHVTAATDPNLVGGRWTVEKTFARVLQSGRVAVHLDTSAVPAWAAQDELFRASAASAVCIPLRGSDEVALLICTRTVARGFQPAHEQMARRFQPLATQALRDAERVAHVERTNRDMRLVLDAVDQGLLTLDRESRIVGQTSGVVPAWFGEIQPKMKFTELVARVAPAAAEQFNLFWGQVVDGFLPLALALDVMPRQIQTSNRTFSLRLAPIGADETWTRMLVIISDVTAALEHDRAEQARREFATVVTSFIRDGRAFREFFDESGAAVKTLAAGRAGDRAAQLRLLHTLKGNASASGLDSVARIAHTIEDRLREDTPDEDQYAELVARWRALEEELAPVLGAPPPGIAITEGEHGWLVSALREAGVPSPVIRVVETWRDEPVGITLERLKDRSRVLGQLLGKPNVVVAVEHDGLRLDGSTYRSFFAALIHAARNAFDHGIEDEPERKTRGKSGPGKVTFRAWRTGDRFAIEVDDDGRGIDWPKIRDKARALGLAHTTEDELVAALFAEGLSTRDAVTSVSGRGVGMAALRETVQHLGGTIEVESTFGIGTRVRCGFPLS